MQKGVKNKEKFMVFTSNWSQQNLQTLKITTNITKLNLRKTMKN